MTHDETERDGLEQQEYEPELPESALAESDIKISSLCPICEHGVLNYLAKDFTECSLCYSSFSDGHSFTFPWIARFKNAEFLRKWCIRLGIEPKVSDVRKWARNRVKRSKEKALRINHRHR
jgi:hypothetical protein